MTRNSSENDAAASCAPTTVLQSSLINTAARSPLVKLLDIDRVLRRNSNESNSATAEASRTSSSHISISFSKKAAEDSEDESEVALAIKIPPAAVPVPPVPGDIEPNESGYDCLI